MGNTQVQSPHCNTTDKLPEDVPEQNTWMAKIKDDIPITLLSIPGTHCSCSAFLNSPAWRHQSLGIQHALRAGIRYFDVPLKLGKGSQLMLWQDYYPIGREFRSFLEPLVYFLTINASEVVICRLTEAYSSEGDKNFSDVLCLEIDRYVPEKRLWKFHTLPDTLGEARGMIIFLRDFPDGRGRLVPFFNCVLCNQIGLPTCSKEFWKLVQKHVINARNGKGDHLFVTYLSHNDMYASAVKVINKKLFDFFKENEHNYWKGIVAMDFPGSELIALLIQKNFTYKVTQIAIRNVFTESLTK